MKTGRPRVLVVGETCKDVFIYGECKRICPEAPVPVFNPLRTVENDGMAANVVLNLAALGVSTAFKTNEGKCPTKVRYVDSASDQMLLRVDRDDAVAPIDDPERIVKTIQSSHFDAVVVSDYNKGLLTVEAIEAIGSAHSVTFLDTKKLIGPWCLQSFAYVKVNRVECDAAERAGMLGDEGRENLIVTDGSKGTWYRGKLFPTAAVDVRDVSGAGDTFLAALVASYVKHKAIRKAIAFANECAGHVVARRGVSSSLETFRV